MIIDSHVHFPFSMPIPEKEWGKYLVDRAARSGQPDTFPTLFQEWAWKRESERVSQ